MSEKRPIGLFDSGVGGLSVLKEIHTLLPDEDILYFADQQHVPYGSRSLDQVRTLSEQIARFLNDQGAKVIVLACNTASAASLHYLRAIFPETPFIGMEPAIKPAAERTKTGIVGVLATPATFQGELFSSVVDRFAEGIQVLETTLPGLVEHIEAGNLEGPEVEEILSQGIEPLIELGADTLVLGCTHYPFVLPFIQTLSGERINVIDPSPAIARRTRQVLEDDQLLTTDGLPGNVRYITTGEVDGFRKSIKLLKMPSGEVLQASWQERNLSLTGVGSKE